MTVGLTKLQQLAADTCRNLEVAEAGSKLEFDIICQTLDKAVNDLRAAAWAVIAWEIDYRTTNHLGSVPPSEFARLKKAISDVT